MTTRKPLYLGAGGTPTEMHASDAIPVGLLPVMTGASSTADGGSGIVPAPLMGEHGKFLRGDRQWVLLSSLADPNLVVLDYLAPGDVMHWTGSAWVNSPVVPAATPGVGGVLTYFSASPTLREDQGTNDIPMLTLSKTPITTGELAVSVTVDASGTATRAIAAWLADDTFGTTTIPAGIWTMAVYAGVDSVADGRSTLIHRRVCAASTAAMTLTTTGTGPTRTATAASGTPFSSNDANADPLLANYLATPSGLYQIVGYTSPTVVTLAVPDYVPLPLNPTMTGFATHSSPAGGWYAVAESDHWADGYEGWRAFDGNSGTAWVSQTVSAGFLTIDYGAGVTCKLTAYKITPFSATLGSPKTFAFKGSNNGASWTTLDTQTNMTTGWSDGVERIFSFANTTAYRYYKLEVTNTNAGGGSISVKIVQLRFDDAGDSRTGYVNESAVAFSQWRGLFTSSSYASVYGGIDNNYVEQMWNDLQGSLAVSASGQLGVIDFAQAWAGGPTTLTMLYNGLVGSTRNAMICTPFPAASGGVADHESLTGLQGGTTGQHYHLTSACHTALTALSVSELGYLSGVTSAIQTQLAGKMTNPMTTAGDLLYGSTAGAPTRLANGSAGQLLQSQGGTSPPVWATFTALTNPMTTGGDIIHGGTSGTPTRLANGSTGQVLTANGGTTAPSWQAPAVTAAAVQQANFCNYFLGL
ncbi:MAG: discoidin domain-containing protein [Magnetococcus sp. DMHC-8]